MEEFLAAAGVAFVVADTTRSRWRIGNHRICKTLDWTAGDGLVLAALIDQTTGRSWQPDLRASESAGGEFEMRWGEATLSGRRATAIRNASASAVGSTVTLQLELRLATALDVTLHYCLHSETAAIEQWLEITALEAGTVSHIAPLTVSIAGLPTPTLHWVRGMQGHSLGIPETGSYPAFRVRHEPLGEITLHSGLRSTWNEIAWFVIDSGANTAGILSGLQYSGRWSAHARAKDPHDVALALFVEGCAIPLAAGECWSCPGAFMGVFSGDLDDAAQEQHAFLRATQIPSTGEDFPWVQYNTWFAHLVDFDEDVLTREAELGAQLGAEVFVIDAGWWDESRRLRNCISSGLGMWTPSTTKFPSGLKTFADRVRGLGMRFGLWVEPERVDLRQEATWELQWLARNNDALVSAPWPPATVTGWLCFGHAEVRAWALVWLTRLVSELGVEWLKWDSNWWGVCTRGDHDHSATDGEFYQLQGVHQVLSELRRRFPHLIIENCAGGATRGDFAMRANTHVTWLHDFSTPSRRTRFHLAGAAYPFPPASCNTWVVDADDETLTDPATPRAQLDEIVRSRMFGALGVSAQLMNWSDTAFATVQAAIAQYKRLRPLLRRGRFYHLLPQANLRCEGYAIAGQWEAYAILDQQAEHGAIWVFRAADGPPTRSLQLRGLTAACNYELYDSDTAQVITGTGVRLMAEGITVDLTERTSALILLSAEGAGAGEMQEVTL